MHRIPSLRKETVKTAPFLWASIRPTQRLKHPVNSVMARAMTNGCRVGRVRTVFSKSTTDESHNAIWPHNCTANNYIQRRVNCVYKYPLASDGVLPGGRDSSWPHSLRYSSYGASTKPRLSSPVNWQASFTGKGTDPALRTFKTKMCCGWLSTWTTYVPVLSLLTHRRSYRRFWGLFTLPALHFGNAYVSSG